MKVEILEADVHYIHGIISVVAPRGFGMMLDSADVTKLLPATGVQGYVLERDTVGVTTDAQVDARLLEATLPAGFTKPYAVGATVSARRVTRMELEGADVILTSGTGALTSGSAVNLPLSYLGGKLRAAQGGDEIAFVLRAQLTPEDAANFRLLVERP